MIKEMTISEQELAERFDEVLDSSNGNWELKIYGYNFTPSQILKNCDPVAYRCEMANFADTLTDCGYFVEGH